MSRNIQKGRSAQRQAVAPTSKKVAQGKVAIDKRPTKTLGQDILDHLLEELAMWLRACSGDFIPPCNPDNVAEAKVIWRRLSSGERDPAMTARLVKLMPLLAGPGELPLTYAIRDLVSRPARPALLPIRTVRRLTNLSYGIIRRLVRDGELQPQRGSGNRLYFDAAGVENVLRRHYVGASKPVTGSDRYLLLGYKYNIRSQMDELCNELQINSTIVSHLLRHAMLPSLRVGKSCVVLLDDAFELRDFIQLMNGPHSFMDERKARARNSWLGVCDHYIREMEREAQQRAAADIKKGAETATTAGGKDGVPEQPAVSEITADKKNAAVA